jgi:hypothetical protein
LASSASLAKAPPCEPFLLWSGDIKLSAYLASFYSLLQALALAAWSSPIAAQQRNGLGLGLGGALSLLPPPAEAQDQAVHRGMVAAASPLEQNGGYGSPGLYQPPAGHSSQGPPYGCESTHTSLYQLCVDHSLDRATDPSTSQQPYYPSFPGAIPQAHPPQQYEAGIYSHPPQPSFPSFLPSNAFNSSPYGEAYSPHSASGYTPGSYGVAPSPANGGWDGGAPRWSAPAGPAGERWG